MIENAFQRTPDKHQIGIADIGEQACAQRQQVLNETGVKISYIPM